MSGSRRRGGWRESPVQRTRHGPRAPRDRAVIPAGSEKAAALRLGLSHSTVQHHLANARPGWGPATTLARILAPPAARTRDTSQGGRVAVAHRRGHSMPGPTKPDPAKSQQSNRYAGRASPLVSDPSLARDCVRFATASSTVAPLPFAACSTSWRVMSVGWCRVSGSPQPQFRHMSQSS